MSSSNSGLQETPSSQSLSIGTSLFPLANRKGRQAKPVIRWLAVWLNPKPITGRHRVLSPTKLRLARLPAGSRRAAVGIGRKTWWETKIRIGELGMPRSLSRSVYRRRYRMRGPTNQAMTSLTTLPFTSARRTSRPAYRLVSCSWSRPSRSTALSGSYRHDSQRAERRRGTSRSLHDFSNDWRRCSRKAFNNRL